MCKIFNAILTFDVFWRMTYNGFLCVGIANLVLCIEMLYCSIIYPSLINFTLLLSIMCTACFTGLFLFAVWINTATPSLPYDAEHTRQHTLVVFDSFIQFMVGIMFM